MELLVWVALIVLATQLLDRWNVIIPAKSKQIFYLAIGITLIEAPLRNPYLPIDAYPPRDYQAGIYGTIKGPILTTPVLSTNEITRHILWHALSTCTSMFNHVLMYLISSILCKNRFSNAELAGRMWS